MSRLSLVLVTICCDSIHSSFERAGIKSFLVWQSEAEGMSGESHGWEMSFVACQRREILEHLLSRPFKEWNGLQQRDVADCRRLCRIKKFTFSILDGSRCYCSQKYAVEQTLDSGYCQAACVEAAPKKKQTTSDQNEFILKLEAIEETRKHYETEFTWNQRFCGNDPYLITYSVCPHYLFGAACDETCMCQSKHCNVESGFCFGTKCLDGFEGPRCDIFDLCNENPCQNGGQCFVVERGETYACKCKFGFFGENCESSIEEVKAMNEGSIINVDSADVSDIWRGMNLLVPHFFPVVSLLGCFKLPSGMSHSFSDHFLLQTSIMTVEICLKHCTKNNFTLASLLNGNQCRCSHFFDTFVSVDENQCSTSCHGNEKQLCGGNSSFHIYSLCPPQFYGLKTCQSICNCFLPCNVMTGVCPGRCLPGFEGRRCDIPTWSIANLLTLDFAYFFLCFLFSVVILFGIFIVSGAYLVVTSLHTD